MSKAWQRSLSYPSKWAHTFQALDAPRHLNSINSLKAASFWGTWGHRSSCCRNLSLSSLAQFPSCPSKRRTNEESDESYSRIGTISSLCSLVLLLPFLRTEVKLSPWDWQRLNLERRFRGKKGKKSNSPFFGGFSTFIHRQISRKLFICHHLENPSCFSNFRS